MGEMISKLSIGVFLNAAEENNQILKVIKEKTKNDNAVIRILALAIKKENPEFDRPAIINKIQEVYKYTINNSGNYWHAFGRGDEEIDLEVSKDCNTIQDILDALKVMKPRTLGLKNLDVVFNSTTIEKDGGGIILENQDLSTKLANLINSEVKQIILTGAPGTGKTYVAKKIAREHIMKIQGIVDKKEADKYIGFVQFHPSYDYTDFVEGIRPVEIDKTVTFKKMDGIFKKFCRKAYGKDKDYFFIIDEINRADLSKVFGELMFGLERDKRGEPIITQYQNMKTYFGENEDSENGVEDIYENEFSIPENIYIIGTMNDIDRSVESMDFALRRRFSWINVKANDELSIAFDNKNEKGEYSFFPKIGEDKRDGFVNTIKEQILSLNTFITDKGEAFLLNEHYHISHGYFSNLPDYLFPQERPDEIEEVLNYVWNYRLETLISEYVRGEYGSKEFVKDCKEIFLTIEKEYETESPSSDVVKAEGN